MEKLKWKKASEELPKNYEPILLHYWNENSLPGYTVVETACFCDNRFTVSDDVEFTVDGKLTFDEYDEYGRYNLLWVSLSDVLNLIEE